MERADNPTRPVGQSSVDLLIVGGGIMGLWAAVHAERLGIRALLVEAGHFGQGASGGLLGALMPHMPNKWSDKKLFQFDALVSLEEEIAVLEAETGLSAGYRRAGRLIPLPKPHLRQIALGHSRDAETHWRQDEHEFHWHVLDAAPVSGWIDPAAGESGFVFDTLAARVAPRALLNVLRRYLAGATHVQLAEGVTVESIDPARGLAAMSEGDIRFDRCILAAGHWSFPILDRLTEGRKSSLGQPVKGQAAMLKADVDGSLPVIFRDGLYIVPHEDGLVAVGSTSENHFDDPLSTDGQLDDLLAAARIMAPVLAGAEVVERWAGLRPKAVDRDPMVGAHPDHRSLIALTGGFKVSFGLAHRLAEAAVRQAADMACSFKLPQSFTLASHISVISHKT
ncbi:MULTISPECIES: FAD-binding oxidoreductase [unclassified Rhizobium]|uniref:NAD(P)/FAD-dependent oxidoreductase n=1 Tax=unclassified Rhizobium TaxID=2613769 RepID=UPI001616EEDA|nr:MULTISPECIES: FAD-binding oxidoreductase [unclassified Rhizobium]MBB3287790.1 glycine oxidase [Rhizobium sp. BK252]MBB3402606.1 glycine oxidase [Rhizobium sp. BK289]MBB3415182.1 glycine oxidase [Rhizobium sp. BK284]MBB3483071.1 glycine oxidase [Rhizobium sp. BK347]